MANSNVSDGGRDAGGVDQSDVGGWPDAMNEQETDGCIPPTVEELCSQSAIECGPLNVVDKCGQPRDVDCSCGSTSYCDGNVCIEYTYTWGRGRVVTLFGELRRGNKDSGRGLHAK